MARRGLLVLAAATLSSCGLGRTDPKPAAEYRAELEAAIKGQPHVTASKVRWGDEMFSNLVARVSVTYDLSARSDVIAAMDETARRCAPVLATSPRDGTFSLTADAGGRSYTVSELDPDFGAAPPSFRRIMDRYGVTPR